MNKLIIIDSNGVMHRAYHAYPHLSANNIPTNVVYGFLAMIYKLMIEFSPNYFIAVFDTPKPTFRKELYQGYQIQRPKMEEDFAVQIPLVKEALDCAGILRLEKDGYEADDIIGTICHRLKNRPDLQIVIISSDQDIFQLIDKNIIVASPITGLTKIKIYDEAEVKKKLRISPKQIVDYKALVGDASDNYPGAKGIGPMTAVKLISRFETVDNLLQNLNQIKSEKIRKILVEEKNNIYLSRKLAQIVRDVPLDIDIEKARINGFNRQLESFLEKYQIFSLLRRIFGERQDTDQIKPKKQSTEKKKKEKENQEKQISLF